MLSVLRPVITGVLFVASIANRVFYSFGFYRFKNRLSQISFKKLSTQMVSLSLIIAMLTTSTPAAPVGLATAISEIGQDIRYSYLSGNLGANLLSWNLLGFLIKTPVKKKQQKVERIFILPAGTGENGGLTVLQGEKINFSAVGVGGDAQPISGLQFKWSVTDTTRNRPARPLSHGNFTAETPGIFIVAVEASGRQSQITITVNPSEGYGMQKLMQKDEAARSDKQRQQLGAFKEKGMLVSREISSRGSYSFEEEKQLNEIDKKKQTEVKVKQLERLQKNPNPLQNPNRNQNPNQNPNVNDGNSPRRGGPNAEDTEIEYRNVSDEPAPESAETAPAAASAPRPIDEIGWNGDNWWTADDPINQVGNTPGSAPASGAGNGNFQLAAPVVSLPGRAGLDVNLALVYNSRLWSKAGSWMMYDSDKGNPAPGWSLGFGKMIRMGGTGGCMLVSPDGARHSYNGTNSTYSYGGYYSNYYTGYTTDGSFIDYNCSYASSTYGTGLSGTARLANGTIVTYSSPTGSYDQVFPTQIMDAQGNYINITYVNNQGPNIQTITDTLGRVVSFNYDSSNRLISVTGPAKNGATRTLVRLHYRQLNLSYAFASGIYTDTPTNSPYVLDAIYYPELNTGYWFGENNSYSSYGMITRVIEARGMSWSGNPGDQGTIALNSDPSMITREQVYNFDMTANSALTDAPTYTTLTETWANMDTSAAVTNFSVTRTTTDEIITVTAPNGTKSRQTSHLNSGQWNDGMYYLNETLAPNDALLGKTKTFLAQGNYGATRPTRVESTDEKGQTTAAEFSYGTNLYNQVTEQREYNYGGSLYRKSVTAYENNAAYTNRHIFNLVKSIELYDSSGTNKLSRTDYEYDNNAVVNGTQNHNLTATPGVIMHHFSFDPYTTMMTDGETCIDIQYYECGAPPYDPITCEYCNAWEQVSAYDPNTIFRGNVTKATTYTDANNIATAIPYTSTYDVTGNLRTTTTDCCQQMSFDYAQTFQYAYPHSMTKGSSDQSAQITQGAWYDYNTGLQTSATDFNGRVTWFHHDAANRPTWTVLPTGGKHLTAYGDNGMYIESSTFDSADNRQSMNLTFFNGRGQVRASSYFSRVTGNFWDGANFNQTDIKYDQMGRKTHQSIVHPANVTPGTSDWTTFHYDQLSRTTQVTAPDGSTSKTFYNENSRPDSASNLPGQTVSSQDAWGRERWARTDDFGRLAEVVEPNPNSTGGMSNSGSLQTVYSYDAVDRLTQVTQGAQTRAFQYDSLGRLVRQKLAEQNGSLTASGQFVGGNAGGWSDVFEYDARSNLTKRIDARGVKTIFTYNSDPLNRLQSVSYDKTGADTTYTIHDASPLTLSYMTTGDKTRVSQVQSWWTTETNSYDTEGRISEYSITLPSTSQPLTTSYLYDQLHRLTEIRYPAQYGMAGNPRKVVTPSYDETSRLKELKVDNQIQMNEIVYNPMSQVTSLKTGAATNNADIETYTYDNQTGLLTGQTVVKANTNQQLMNLSYYYDRGHSNGTINGKTGQLTKIVDNLDHNKNRLYEHDALGRLATAKGGAAAYGTPTANWTQSYAYDRYGNRTNVAKTGITSDSQAVPLDGLANQSYDQSSNRITTQIGNDAYLYDLAGNLVKGQDAAGNWQHYEYDTAGRMLEVKNSSGNGIQGNGYGSGRQRLVRNETGTLTWYAWGGSSVLAEYTSANWGGAMTWKKSYVYAGSRLLTTYTNNGSGGETQEFHHPDRLGTRLVTNNAANTSFEQSTLPFGTALGAESTGSTNQRFTSYDRSAVTGIDYAVNRHYSPGQGRFTTVDPIGMGAVSVDNPQSMNLYAYAGNNPVDFVDPSGLNMSSVSYYCYDLTTYYTNADGTSIRTETTTVCNFYGGSGGGGGGGGFEPGGGGGGGSPGTGEQPPAQQTPCARMAQRVEDFINDEIESLGGVGKITTHNQLNSLVNNLNSRLTNFYVGKDTIDSTGATPPPAPNGGAGGFRGEYVDSLDENEDQTHHFVGYLNAGITGSVFKAFAHKWGTDYNNPGDRALGDVAYSMGASLNMRTRTVTNRTNPRYPVPQRIPEPVGNRLQRILGLANRIRNEICQ